MYELSILSLNCRGLNDYKKRIDVFNFLKDQKHHIYCLQDTHFTKKQEKAIYAQWSGECLFSFSKSNARGVAILFNKNLEYEIHKKINDDIGNFIALDVTIEKNRLTLVNLYGPNNDNPDFYEKVFETIDGLNNDKYIICGDFNLVLNPEIDYYNYKRINNKKARENLLKHITERLLIDPFRDFFPSVKRYTWRRCNPVQQARLDFFLVTEDLVPNIKNCEIQSSYKSDHSFITLNINFSDISHGKGLWKHNNALLNDVDYIASINKKINDIKQQYCLPVYNLDNINDVPNDEIQFIINDQLFLETLLMELRGQSISYASFVKKKEI